MKFTGQEYSSAGGTRPAPHGAGGLKSLLIAMIAALLCPAPHGAGGLKWHRRTALERKIAVPPRTGRVD